MAARRYRLEGITFDYDTGDDDKMQLFDLLKLLDGWDQIFPEIQAPWVYGEYIEELSPEGDVLDSGYIDYEDDGDGLYLISLRWRSEYGPNFNL